MPFEFKLPDIGEGVAEGEIIKWLVEEGAEVREDDPLVEVLTDKANVEIPAPRSGTVLKILAAEGEVIPVGRTIVVIGTPGEAPEVAEAAPLEEPGREEIAEPDGRGPAVSEEPSGRAQTPRPMATPATRRLARELGVDLSLIEGTGPKGRITKEDVQRAVAEREEVPEVVPPVEELRRAPVAPATGEERRVPLRGLRRRIAEKMVTSKRTAPHYTYVDEVDASKLVALREEAKPLADEQGVRLTYLSFIVKAVVAALKESPYLNASLDDEAEEIVLKGYYNIGIAVATDEGLTVPVVKEADRKSILSLSQEIEVLAEKARAGKLALQDLQGGTFTITSLGPLGGLFATPIINYPEVAILGVHEIKEKPVVRDGEVVPGKVMLLSLSFDHRVVDGAMGAEFARRLIRYLEEPSLLFMEML